MDCNSYSYTPYMLSKRESLEEVFENDDIVVELSNCGESIFSVWAFSYDGSMDVFEEFTTIAQARQLYDYIVENYADNVPGEELYNYIEEVKKNAY